MIAIKARHKIATSRLSRIHPNSSPLFRPVPVAIGSWQRGGWMKSAMRGGVYDEETMEMGWQDGRRETRIAGWRGDCARRSLVGWPIMLTGRARIVSRNFLSTLHLTWKPSSPLPYLLYAYAMHNYNRRVCYAGYLTRRQCSGLQRCRLEKMPSCRHSSTWRGSHLLAQALSAIRISKLVRSARVKEQRPLPLLAWSSSSPPRASNRACGTFTMRQVILQSGL